MPWIITLPIGILIGVLFSVAFPSVAQGINDALLPTIAGIFDKSLEIGVDIIFNSTGET